MKLNSIIIDTDGVLRDFVGTLVKLFKKCNPDKEIQTIDRYNIWENFNITKEKFYSFVYEQYPKELFLKARAYNGAVGFIKDLYKRGFRIILASSQPTFECKQYTMEWYKNHKMPIDDVVFIDSKSDYKADIIIEDSFNQINKACVSRHITGSPLVIFKFDQPWNKNTNKDLLFNYDRTDLPITAIGKDTVGKYRYILKCLDDMMDYIPERDGWTDRLYKKILNEVKNNE